VSKLRVISLGWGVQSFALAAMSALGELPPVDAAIHADTTHERSETYAFAQKWTPWLEEHGVRVITARGWDRYMAPYGVKPRAESKPQILIPVYKLFPDGPGGMLRRQCTGHWKIQPIRRWIQANRNGEQAEQWLGITLDEWTRMKDADVQYVKNTYPFMDFFDQPWTRGRVIMWLRDNGLEVPVKSGCVFCPYHDFATWREIKVGNNGDWDRAVEVDRDIRNQKAGFECYIHRKFQPLDKIDFRNEQDHGQLELWGEECTGMCFL